MNTSENEFVFEIDKPKSHTKSLNDDHDDETNQLLEKAKDVSVKVFNQAKDVGIKFLNKTQDIWDDLITKTKEKWDDFEKHLSNKHFKSKIIDFFKKYKKLSSFVIAFIMLGILWVVITPLLVTSIYYNKIPKNYKDSININRPIDFLWYVNYDKVLPNITWLTLWLVSNTDTNYNESDNVAMYTEYNVWLWFQITKESETYFSESYNSLFKKWIDVWYLLNANKNLLSMFWWVVSDDKYSLYKDNLFKSLNKYVDDGTFFAFWKKVWENSCNDPFATCPPQTSLLDILVKVNNNEGLFSLSTLMGETNDPNLNDNGVVFLTSILPLIEWEFSKIASDYSYLMMSLKDDRLIINMIHKTANKQYKADSYEKFFCSDFKTLHLRSNNILNDFKCEYFYNKNEIQVILSYGDFNNLQKSLFNTNNQWLNEWLSGDVDIFWNSDESVTNRDPFEFNENTEFIKNYYTKLQEKDWNYIATHTRRSKNWEYIKRTEEEVKKLYINVSDIRQWSLDIQSIPFEENKYYVNTSVNLNEWWIVRTAYCKTTKQIMNLDWVPVLITLSTNSCKD